MYNNLKKYKKKASYSSFYLTSDKSCSANGLLEVLILYKRITKCKGSSENKKKNPGICLFSQFIKKKLHSTFCHKNFHEESNTFYPIMCLKEYLILPNDRTNMYNYTKYLLSFLHCSKIL